jgi:hypothetical protein
MWEWEFTQKSWYAILGLLLCFRSHFYSSVFQLFLAGPIRLGPSVLGIFGYASLFHVFLDVGQP